MKKRKPLLILSVLIVAAVLVWYFMFQEKIDPNRIRISGNIEVTDVDLSFRIPGKIEQCLRDEGDRVSKGDLMARLENQDQQVQVRIAQANLDRAGSMLAELEAGSRPEEIQLARANVLQARQALLELTRGSRRQEIESAQADLDAALAAEKSAKSNLKQAKTDWERFQILYKEKTATQRDVELFRTRYEVAKNSMEEAVSNVNRAGQALSLRKEGPRKEQIEKAKAALEQAEAQYALVKAGPRPEKIDQARAQVNDALERLNQASLQLTYTDLSAPMDGVILTRAADSGEYMNPSTPVFTLGDLDHPWMRAYVSERNLGRIKIGDWVDVSTDSFPGKIYKGKISYISSEAEFTPKSVQTFEERVKLVYRIKISLPNPDHELRPGMPADGVIQIPEKQ